MERKKRSNDNKPLWRKITPGVLYLPTHSGGIKPKQEVRLAQEELLHKGDEFELVEDGKGQYEVSGKSVAAKDDAPASDEEQVATEDQATEEADKEDKEEEGESAAEKEAGAETPEAETYEIVHTGSGWYDVMSSEGKQMNEKAMRSADAQAFKEQLEQEQEQKVEK